jgi:ElaA protein
MNYQWQSLTFAQLGQARLYAVLRLRQEVFAVEQQSIYLDLDGLDQQAIHMLCSRDEQLLAYQRCLPPGVSYPESSLGRIVVSPGARGLHLGVELVQRGISHNLQHWPDSGIRINAQSYLQKFYINLGFVTDGDEYDEDGIPHLQMLYRAGCQTQ